MFAITTISILISCNGKSEKKSKKKSERFELVPEPDKALRLEYEAIERLKKSGCKFSEPDTSLSGIILRDTESTTKIIGKDNKTDNNGQYHFYSGNGKEILTLTQHPGDGKNQISIIKVELPDKTDHNYTKLDFDAFKTEKEIQLGWTKQQVIDRLGNCCMHLDYTENHTELRYSIVSPNDSRTNFLAKNNMPVYYASYEFWKGKLVNFEFGFEYP